MAARLIRYFVSHKHQDIKTRIQAFNLTSEGADVVLYIVRIDRYCSCKEKGFWTYC